MEDQEAGEGQQNGEGEAAQEQAAAGGKELGQAKGKPPARPQPPCSQEEWVAARQWRQYQGRQKELYDCAKAGRIHTDWAPVRICCWSKQLANCCCTIVTDKCLLRVCQHIGVQYFR